MKTTTVATEYCIELTIDEMKKILEKDRSPIQESDQTLFDRLSDIEGPEDIEYSGHFGANIYLTLPVEYDKERTWNQIEEAIGEYIK